MKDIQSAFKDVISKRLDADKIILEKTNISKERLNSILNKDEKVKASEFIVICLALNIKIKDLDNIL